MTKYDLFTETFEFRSGADEEWTDQDIMDAYITQRDHYPIRVAQADRLEDLAGRFREESLKCYTYRQQHATGWLIRGEMCYIESGEYDEDGEYIQGGDICDYYVVPLIEDEEDEEDA